MDPMRMRFQGPGGPNFSGGGMNPGPGGCFPGQQGGGMMGPGFGGGPTGPFGPGGPGFSGMGPGPGFNDGPRGMGPRFGGGIRPGFGGPGFGGMGPGFAGGGGGMGPRPAGPGIKSGLGPGVKKPNMRNLFLENQETDEKDDKRRIEQLQTEAARWQQQAPLNMSNMADNYANMMQNQQQLFQQNCQGNDNIPLEELKKRQATFKQQVQQWEEQFRQWKEENKSHPDKDLYRSYEQQWREWEIQIRQMSAATEKEIELKENELKRRGAMKSGELVGTGETGTRGIDGSGPMGQGGMGGSGPMGQGGMGGSGPMGPGGMGGPGPMGPGGMGGPDPMGLGGMSGPGPMGPGGMGGPGPMGPEGMGGPGPMGPGGMGGPGPMGPGGMGGPGPMGPGGMGGPGPIGPCGMGGPGPIGPGGLGPHGIGGNGPMGMGGPMGPNGPMGMGGPMGPNGPMGMGGPMGPNGPMGMGGLGPMGPDGPMGMGGPGPMGPDGPMGMGGPGPMGPDGPMGMGGPGPMGPDGPMGMGGPGPMGPDGPMGMGGPGPMGPDGPMGMGGPGPMGPDGPMGMGGPGFMGPDGPMGMRGPGPMGPDRPMGKGGPGPGRSMRRRGKGQKHNIDDSNAPYGYNKANKPIGEPFNGLSASSLRRKRRRLAKANRLKRQKDNFSPEPEVEADVTDDSKPPGVGLEQYEYSLDYSDDDEDDNDDPEDTSNENIKDWEHVEHANAHEENQKTDLPPPPPDQQMQFQHPNQMPFQQFPQPFNAQQHGMMMQMPFFHPQDKLSKFLVIQKESNEEGKVIESAIPKVSNEFEINANSSPVVIEKQPVLNKPLAKQIPPPPPSHPPPAHVVQQASQQKQPDGPNKKGGGITKWDLQQMMNESKIDSSSSSLNKTGEETKKEAKKITEEKDKKKTNDEKTKEEQKNDKKDEKEETENVKNDSKNKAEEIPKTKQVEKVNTKGETRGSLKEELSRLASSKKGEVSVKKDKFGRDIKRSRSNSREREKRSNRDKERRSRERTSGRDDKYRDRSYNRSRDHDRSRERDIIRSRSRDKSREHEIGRDRNQDIARFKQIEHFDDKNKDGINLASTGVDDIRSGIRGLPELSEKMHDNSPLRTVDYQADIAGRRTPPLPEQALLRPVGYQAPVRGPPSPPHLQGRPPYPGDMYPNERRLEYEDRYEMDRYRGFERPPFDPYGRSQDWYYDRREERIRERLPERREWGYERGLPPPPSDDLYYRRAYARSPTPPPAVKIQTIDYGHGTIQPATNPGLMDPIFTPQQSGQLGYRSVYEPTIDNQYLSTAAKRELINIKDILTTPGSERSTQIVIILRGPPGAGKTYMAKLLKEKEIQNGGQAPRMLCLDDYFMMETEKMEKDPETGKMFKRKVMEYEFEPEMEEAYRSSLLKSFKKTIDSGLFSFIILDAINNKKEHYDQFWAYGRSKGFEVYIVEVMQEVSVCHKRCEHNRSFRSIELMIQNWEVTPSHYQVVDVRDLLQEAAIDDVVMEDFDPMQMPPAEAPEEAMKDATRSRWDEYTMEKLDKLDGIGSFKRRRSESEMPAQSLEEYLSVTDDYAYRKCEPGKKRVRWADIEEKKDQDLKRAMGFVVGQTQQDWQKMTDDNFAHNALNRTKYF